MLDISFHAESTFVKYTILRDSQLIFDCVFMYHWREVLFCVCVLLRAERDEAKPDPIFTT